MHVSDDESFKSKITGEFVDKDRKSSHIFTKTNSTKIFNVGLLNDQLSGNNIVVINNKSNKIDNINDYDVIYIGGPVWWGHLPMPLFTAIEGLDFAGKIVKPFSTHEGSRLGSIMQDIEKLCKNADIKPGLAIRGSDANSSKDKLKGWCIL